jgi:protein-tyrosine phosphatase
MTATTEIRLEGAANFRDIGGVPGADGRLVKRGQIFRSGELSHLTEADLEILRQLGIGFVADLRSSKECGLHLSRWPDGLNTERLLADIPMDIRLDGRPIMELLLADRSPSGTARTVGMSFPVIADLCGPALKEIAERLVDTDGPILFHCTNGRDRTGVISAMLLYILGAPREVIVADFMLTNERIDVERVVANTLETFRKVLGMEMGRESVEMVTLVRAEYIDAMFNGFETRYGSPEAYLAHFGIDEALRDRLREQLLEEAA